MPLSLLDPEPPDEPFAWLLELPDEELPVLEPPEFPDELEPLELELPEPLL